VRASAHNDHLGREGDDVFRGADDNAAAVAILVETARALAAARATGRGVMIVAFDSEEPPYFMTEAMGAMHFCAQPPVPLDRIDLMIGMDLVGHTLGEGDGMPRDVTDTVFALGAERSSGTSARLDALARAEPGVVVRPADAQIISTMSDYAAFWRRDRPFLFLTNGRSRRYHTVEDTPEHLAWNKMTATARWLERFVRDACERDEHIAFSNRRRDITTIESLIDVLSSLAELSAEAEEGLAIARALRTACDRDGALPEERRFEVESLVIAIESALA
jgi:Zn-dependent M28 family amino/carboxypeptidase